LKSFDADPNADLESLADKALGIEIVKVPESMLTEKQKQHRDS